MLTCAHAFAYADSGTKYFAGHSDALIGTVSVRDKADWVKLYVPLASLTSTRIHVGLPSRSWEDRMATGSVAGSLDSWLLLRSLRTLSIRVKRQAQTATALAKWLASLVDADEGRGVIEKVWHTSLQADADQLLGPGKQLEDGPACFSILLKERKQADKFPEELNYFVVRFFLRPIRLTLLLLTGGDYIQHATSLGGVESLIEQRIISDAKCDPRLRTSRPPFAPSRCRALTFSNFSAPLDRPRGAGGPQERSLAGDHEGQDCEMPFRFFTKPARSVH